jgi:two-component system response regulator ArlR
VARVLVIEDDVSLAMLLAYLLGHEGYDVEVCHDGEEGSPVDAVLVDVMLPGDTSGLDVLRELRQRPAWSEVPAIVVSALSADHHQWEGWSAGASSYVSKPYESDHLLEVLREHLDVAEVRRGLAADSDAATIDVVDVADEDIDAGV